MLLLCTGVHHRWWASRDKQPTTPRNVVAASSTTLTAEEHARALHVKLSIASSTGRLDLSDWELTSVPDAVWDLGSDLEDLTLAGNQLDRIPDRLDRLPNLRRLQLAGNLLTHLPESLGTLERLEGLWVHGNLLQQLPESIGGCTALQQLSVAGNTLRSLPDSICSLTSLHELAAGGNHIATLPADVGALTALTALALHGNALTTVPESVSGLHCLKALWLQGNAMTSLPSLALPALEELSVADNMLTALPPLTGASSLHSLWAYGNALQGLPPALLALPSLRRLWVEGNAGLSRGHVRAMLAARDQAALPPVVVGMDEEEGVEEEYGLALGRQGERALQAQHQAPTQQPSSEIRVSKRLTHGPGYFKLAKGPLPHAGPTFTSQDGQTCARTLVVAFGSAPGTPNWGGLLSRVYAMASEDNHDAAPAGRPIDAAQFDVLYVVDPHRGWYGGGDDGWAAYESQLRRCVEGYARVVLLGDSMGGTAALLASPMATHVLAFCPQVATARVSTLTASPPPRRWTSPARRSDRASLTRGSTR